MVVILLCHLARLCCPVVLANTSVGVAVKEFVDVTNISNQLTLSERDYPGCEWASPNRLKALRV